MREYYILWDFFGKTNKTITITNTHTHTGPVARAYFRNRQDQPQPVKKSALKKQVQKSNFTSIPRGSVLCDYFCDIASITAPSTLRDEYNKVNVFFAIAAISQFLLQMELFHVLIVPDLNKCIVEPLPRRPPV